MKVTLELEICKIPEASVQRLHNNSKSIWNETLQWIRFKYHIAMMYGSCKFFQHLLLSLIKMLHFLYTKVYIEISNINTKICLCDIYQKAK